MSGYQLYRTLSSMFGFLKEGDELSFANITLEGVVIHIDPKGHVIFLDGNKTIQIKHQGDVITGYEFKGRQFCNAIYVCHRTLDMTPEEKQLSAEMKLKQQKYINSTEDEKRLIKLETIFDEIKRLYCETGKSNVSIEYHRYLEDVGVNEFNEYIKNHQPLFARFIQATSRANNKLFVTVFFF